MRSAILAVVTALTLVAFSTADSHASRLGKPSRTSRKEAVREPAPLTLSTFAHTMVLDGDAGAVLGYTLPEAVFKGLSRYDFSDLCVFDAEGSPVPFQVRSLAGENAALEVEKELPYFVWQPEKPGATPPASMDIEINTRGGIVRIKGQTDGVPRPGPVSYLLDMQAFADAMANPVSQSGETFGPEHVLRRVVEVNLAGDNTFMTYATMKTSTDLASWTPIGKPQVLARMLQNDVTMVRDTLHLPSGAKRYILIELSDSEAPVFSFTAKAAFGKRVNSYNTTLVAGTLSGNKRVVSYQVPGRFPLVSLGFMLPQTEMMAVHVRGTSDPAKPYPLLAKGFIYRLEKDGATITGDPFPIKKPLQYWQLEAAGDIPFVAAPTLSLAWQPRELLFLARGKGPWTLAYGREDGVGASSLPMLAQADIRPAKEIVAPVQDVPAQPPRKSPEEQSEWVLWAVLGLAVAFLTGITVWLMKSMGGKKE